MTNIFDPVTLTFAAIAVITLWRLWSSLGKTTGHERPPELYKPKEKQEKQNAQATALAEEKQIAPVWQGFAAEGSPLAQGLIAIHQADPIFSPQNFLAGAKMAYEMVLEAFASGDKKQLQSLLVADIYDDFSAAIMQRQENQQKATLNFIGFEKAKILEASLKKNIAAITVQFEGQMLSALYDQKDVLIEGSTDEVETTNDTWTFERDVTRKNPNWLVAATVTR